MIEIEESSGNVYVDLGIPNADEMLVKAQLATKIGEIIKTRRWTQQRAAEVLGMTQPKLSKMLRGRFREASEASEASEAKILECLAKLEEKDLIKRPMHPKGGARHDVNVYSFAELIAVALPLALELDAEHRNSEGKISRPQKEMLYFRKK